MGQIKAAPRTTQPEAIGGSRIPSRRRSVGIALLLASASPVALLAQMGIARAQVVIDGGSIVTVPGTFPSPWNIGGTLFVGNTGIGTLTINSGGSVSSGLSYLGLGPTGSGTVTVTGPGSNWATSANLYVGASGTGTLMIDNRGIVATNGHGTIGSGAGSFGTVRVTGLGSSWSTTGVTHVGSGGTGTLLIDSGGQVSSPLALIGQLGTSTGTATVTGAGSTWNSGIEFVLGVAGTATLTIADGGAVTTPVMVVARDAGHGTLNLTGTAAARGRLTTGQITKGAGNATLNLDGGILQASASQASFLNGFSAGDVTIGAGGAFIDTNGFDVGIAAPLGGTGGLTKQDTGTLTLSGPNTYTGGTTIEGGMLRLAPGGTLGATSNTTTIQFGSVLDLGGTTQTQAALNMLTGTVQNGTMNADTFRLAGGTVAANATINSPTAFDLQAGTVYGVLGGAGSLSKTGLGTVTLTNANTYTSGTTVRAGTLEVQNRDALGTSLVRLAGGHLRSNIAGTTTLPNEIRFQPGQISTLSAAPGQTLSIDFFASGSGSTIRFGTPTDTGTIIVAGPSFAYSRHALEVNGGTLRAGSDQLSSHLNGAHTVTIARDATLDLAIYDTRISNLQGDGTLISNAPRLRILSGTFGGTIAGSAALVKPWTGTLTLTGTSTLTGPTTVEDGKLVINGSLASSPVTVAGGSLGGTGTIGGLSVQSGGTAAPGNSIGTLSVNGNVSFASGSLYALEIDKAGRSDRIAATGAATLSGGTVQILPDQGTGYVENSPYLILTARKGVTGKFAGTSGGSFAFVTPTLDYTGDRVTLTLVRKTEPTDPDNPTDPVDPADPAPIRFHSVAETINQYRTADAVEVLGAGNSLYSTVLGASAAGARQAFDALSGEAHASAMSVAYEDGRLVREAILTRLRQGSSLPTLAQGSHDAAYAADVPGAVPQAVPVPGPSLDPRRFALWGEGFGSWGKVASNGNAASLDTSTGGFILGADAALDPVWRLGFAGGFTRTSFDIDGRLSSGTNDSIFGALYGSGSWGALSLRMGAAYAWHDVDIRRRVQFPGFADSTSTSYDGWSAQAFAEFGYGFDLGNLQLEPFIGASVLRLHTDAFREEGGAAALTGLGQDQDLATTTLGLRAQARLSADTPLILRGMLGWRHAFGDVEPEALLAFAGSNTAFAVAGVPVDRNALAIEAGLDWQASDALSLGVAYSGQIGERAQEHALKGNLVWRFGTR